MSLQGNNIAFGGKKKKYGNKKRKRRNYFFFSFECFNTLYAL